MGLNLKFDTREKKQSHNNITDYFFLFSKMNQVSLKTFFSQKNDLFILFSLTYSCADQKAWCSAELIWTSDVHV